MFFYLVFPFLLLRLRPSTRAKAGLAVCAFWLLAMLAPLLCVLYYPASSWTEGGGGAIQVFRVHRLPLLALPEFLAGVSLGWIHLRFPPSQKIAQYLAPIGVIAFTVGLILSAHLPNVMIHNGLFIPFYALIILGLSQRNWLSNLLSASWLRRALTARYSTAPVMGCSWVSPHPTAPSIVF